MLPLARIQLGEQDAAIGARGVVPGLEREDLLVGAALSAFVKAFANARVVQHDLALGDGRSWSWLAELADGGLCAVLVVEEARAREVGDVLDALARLDEGEAELRAVLGMAPLDRERPPRALLVAESFSRGYLQRAQLIDPSRVESLELLRIRTKEHSSATLSPVRPTARRSVAGSSPSRRTRATAEFSGEEDMLALLQQRLVRLDPQLQVEREPELTVFRVYGHELARVQTDQQPPKAQIGAGQAALELDGLPALELFLARVVDRYLELGCWTGADGGPASLALVEPLLTHEELAAFRELA